MAAAAEVERPAKTLKQGDTIIVAGCVRITLRQTWGNKARFEIDAPAGMPVSLIPYTGLVSVHGS